MKYISVLILPFVHKKNRDKKYLGFNFVGKRRPLAHGLLFSFFVGKRRPLAHGLPFVQKRKTEIKIISVLIYNLLSERGDSNARPLRPERSALPTALLSDCGAKLRTFYEKSKFIAPKT